MGTKVAPSYMYANPYIFENQFIYTCCKEPALWLRFIDDIFVILTFERNELDDFISYLNDCMPSFKFFSEIFGSEVAFLDTKVKLIDSRIVTDLYAKATDSHNYLHYQSACSLSCKTGIPYGQFLRYRHILSDLKDYDHIPVTTARHLLRKRYPSDIIESGPIRAR